MSDLTRVHELSPNQPLIFRRWSAEEISILTKEYPTIESVADLAIQLNRSEIAVRRKAQGLGLIRDMSPEHLFWSKVVRSDGCWEWTGAKTPKGYGNLLWDGEYTYAHRVSWRIHFGPIPVGQSTLHDCDNPSCVRPDHLFLGTHQDNMDDMKSKGRSNRSPKVTGEAHPSARLSKSDVKAIRNAAKEGVNAHQLGRQYGVTPGAIRHIIKRRTWRNVED